MCQQGPGGHGLADSGVQGAIRQVIKDNKTPGSAEHAAGQCSIHPPPAGGDGDSQQQSYTWEVGGERKPGSSSEDGPSQTDQKGEQHSQAMRT